MHPEVASTLAARYHDLVAEADYHAREQVGLPFGSPYRDACHARSTSSHYKREQQCRREALNLVADMIGGTHPEPISRASTRWCDFAGIKRSRFAVGRQQSIDSFFAQARDARGATDHRRVSYIPGSKGHIAAIISAPYVIPDTLKLGENVTGFLLSASWYGHGSAAIVWVNRQRDVGTRAGLSALLGERDKVEREMLRIRRELHIPEN